MRKICKNCKHSIKTCWKEVVYCKITTPKDNLYPDFNYSCESYKQKETKWITNLKNVLHKLGML